MKSKVVSLNDFSKEKLIKDVEDIRKSNYDVIRAFPLLDNVRMLDTLRSYEENTQLGFMNVYTKGVDPCYSFFGVGGWGEYGDNFIHTLFIRSAFSAFVKRVTPGRDTIVEDDGNLFEKLPLVVSIRYVDCPSPYVNNSVRFRDIVSSLIKEEGIHYFFSLVIVMLVPYIGAGSTFKFTSANVVSRYDDNFNTESLLEITIDDGKHHLLLSIDIDLCNKEIQDYRVRVTTEG